MTAPQHKICDDFDRIARATASLAERPGAYDAFLIRQVPAECARVLEIGCGLGAFSRALAARGYDVDAVDLSPEMIRAARSRTPPSLAIAFRCADFMCVDFARRQYDAVVSIAMLHHVDVTKAIPRMDDLVRPGGVLLVHDVRSDAGVCDWPRSALALVARTWWRARGGQWHVPSSVRAAWDEHGRDEQYATIDEVREWAKLYLPGARVVRHLQWRYTVVWHKPGAG